MGTFLSSDQLLLRERFLDRGPIVTLELAQPDAYAYIEDFYGGGASLASFSRTAQLVQAAREKPGAAAYLTEQQHDPGSAPAFCDGVCIDFAALDGAEHRLTAQALAGFDRLASFLDHELLLYDSSTGEVLARAATSTAAPNLERLFLDCQNGSLPSSPEEASRENLVLMYTACWLDGAQGADGCLRAQVCSQAIGAATLTASAIESVVRIEPMGRENTAQDLAPSTTRRPLPEKDPVIISYNRSGRDIDIMYHDEASGINLMVPIAATATFAAGSAPFDSFDPQNFSLKLFCEGTYTAYETRGRMDAIAEGFKPEGDGFAFALPEPWNRAVPTHRLPLRDRVDWSLYASVYHTNGSRSSLFLSSLLDPVIPAGAYYLRVPSLQILWGCLAKGTMITLADGTLRPVEILRPGDSVAQGDGTAARVTDVMRGWEETLCTVQARSGRGLHEITVTEDHPFRSEGCWISAKNLTGATVLDGEFGPMAIEALFPVQDAFEVYNPRLENDGGSLIANGFIVGDLDAQNRASAMRLRKGANPFAAECAQKARLLAEKG